MFKNIEEYCELIDKIENCLNWFKNKEVSFNRYKLFLSNGEMIEVTYDLNCLPHLLGINTNFLRSTGLYKGSSIEILQSIIDNPNHLYNQFKNGHIHKTNVFSDYIDQKLNNFQNICNINIFDIEFIAKYQSNKNYASGNQKLDGDYYIAYKKDNNISIIGLKQNDDGLYHPITNLEYDEYSEEYYKFLNQLLTNQSLTSVKLLQKNFLNVDGTIARQKFFYNNKEKLTKLKTLNRYADNYNCAVTTNDESIFHVSKVSNLYEEKKKIFEIVMTITNAIKRKTFIDATKLENEFGDLDESLLNLISTHNNSLTTNDEQQSTNINANAESHYKDLILELRNSKKEIEEKDALIEKINTNNEKLTEENQTLKETNNEYQEKEAKIRQILG